MPGRKRTYWFLLMGVIGLILLYTLLDPMRVVSKKETASSDSFDDGKSSYVQDTIWIGKLEKNAIRSLQFNSDSTIILLRQALSVSKKYGDAGIDVRLLSTLASAYIRRGDYNNAKNVLDTAFQKAKAINNPDMAAVLYNASAILYQQNGQYTKSIYNYFEGIDLLKKNGMSNTLRAAKLYNNLAGLFILLQENKQALVYLNEARKILNPDSVSHRSTLAYILCNSGIIKSANQAQEAEKELKQALALSSESNDAYLENKILINLSSIALTRNDYKYADELLVQALHFAQRSKNPISIVLTDYGMGHSRLYQKKYAAAIPLLEAAWKQSITTGYSDAMLTIAKDLKEAYTGINDFRNAYRMQEAYYNLKDSIQQQEKSRTFDLVIQYQAAEKNKQLAESQLELNRQQTRIRQKNTWIGIIIIVTTSLCFVVISLYINSRNKQRLQAQQLQNVSQQRDIDRLTAAFEGEERERTRMSRDIHDGVLSSFAMVRWKINLLSKEVPELSENANFRDTIVLFDKATNELRMTAHNLMPDLLLEDGITKAIYYFVKGVEEHMAITVLFEQLGEPPALQPNFQLFLYRAVQELIQNVVKHSQATQMIVQLMYDAESISITVEDNGVGMDTTGKGGMGLMSLKNGVKLFSGELNINSKPGIGTSVMLDFLIK